MYKIRWRCEDCGESWTGHFLHVNEWIKDTNNYWCSQCTRKRDYNWPYTAVWLIMEIDLSSSGT